jgi:filamentous hemagglutinin family protein
MPKTTAPGRLLPAQSPGRVATFANTFEPTPSLSAMTAACSVRPSRSCRLPACAAAPHFANVGEVHTRGQGLRAVAAAVLALLTAPAFATGVLPTGGQVTAGTASIAQAGQTMTITQTSARLSTDWQQFDIGRGYTVQFVQPSRSAVAFNRIVGPDVSTIQGALKANGQVFLINPNGVLFTPTAQVNVGTLVASTLALSADDGAGRTTFTGATATSATSAHIVNQGSLQVAEGGAVALIAARIDNAGSIAAPKGQVLMGAGSQVTLDLGGPVKLSVDRGAVETWIANGGAIRADGGQVLLTSRAARSSSSPTTARCRPAAACARPAASWRPRARCSPCRPAPR